MDTIPRAQRSARRYAAALLRDARIGIPMRLSWQRPPQWAVVGLAYAQARWQARWQARQRVGDAPYRPNYICSP